MDHHRCRRAPTVVVVRGGLEPADVRAVCDRVRAELAAAAAGHRVVCVLADAVDLGLVDLLARLTVTARRAGAVVRVSPAGDDLRALLQLVGLDRELGRD